MGVSVTQQVVLHPLSYVQAEHWERLEGLDAKGRKLRRDSGLPEASGSTRHAWPRPRRLVSTCVSGCTAASGGARSGRYLVPGAGLIIFELVRRKYGFGGHQVRINRDGYDILLH
ncbi:hypothetical protein VTI74DRAFT_7925 [Chaetomium olivicolor]